MNAKLFKWHHQAAWIAGFAALVWGLSGLSHPIMVWLSPTPAAFAPPSWPIDIKDGLAAGDIMRQAGIQNAKEVRIVSDGMHTALLLREEAQDPRRLFDLKTGVEIKDSDRARAIALARHYAGLPDIRVREAHYLTTHTPDYPENNSLLPVWSVHFDRSDDLTVYVDTGSGRLATIDNKARNIMTRIFTNIHTHAYLPLAVEWVRVMLIVIMVGSVFATALLGLGLLVFLKNMPKRKGWRKWHRLIAYMAVIPALTFTTSGLFHLLYNASLTNSPESTYTPQPFTADELALSGNDILMHLSPGQVLDSITTIRGPEEEPLLRLAFAAGHTKAMTAGNDPHAHHGGGSMQENNAPHVMWIKAGTGHMYADGPQAVARAIAINAAGVSPQAIQTITPITGFTNEYGFLFKRLPVWRIATDEPGATRYFIDTVDGVVSARVTNGDLVEGTVFSNLHKWRFMDWIGQKRRDIFMMFFVFMIIGTTTLGWVVQIRRIREKKRKAP